MQGTKRGATLLHEICAPESYAMASLLLVHRAWPNVKGPEGTPLAIAVHSSSTHSRGNTPLIELLLAYGANPDTPTYQGGCTCLHKAATFTSPDNERGEVIELLCRFGASVNIRNDKGEHRFTWPVSMEVSPGLVYSLSTGPLSRCGTVAG